MNWTQAEHAKSSTRALIRIEILTPRAMEAESLGQNVRVFKNHGLIRVFLKLQGPVCKFINFSLHDQNQIKMAYDLTSVREEALLSLEL